MMEADTSPQAAGNGNAGQGIPFDYIKSQHFRVIRADGGDRRRHAQRLHPRRLFQRTASHPATARFAALPDGRLGDEMKNERVSRDSIGRELDVDLFLTLGAAKSIHRWLGDSIV